MEDPLHGDLWMAHRELVSCRMEHRKEAEWNFVSWTFLDFQYIRKHINIME